MHCVHLLCLFISLAITFSCHADPWGKDSDLVSLKCEVPPPCSQKITTPIAGPITEAFIKFYQTTFSPAVGPHSNYFPTSSHYALQSMRKHGFINGFWMGCDRLMRENTEDWVYPTILMPNGKFKKWDPVP